MRGRRRNKIEREWGEEVRQTMKIVSATLPPTFRGTHGLETRRLEKGLAELPRILLLAADDLDFGCEARRTDFVKRRFEICP